MKATLRFITVVLVCAVLFGVLPANAGPAVPGLEQDAGVGPAGSAGVLTASQLGVAPGADPQPLPVAPGDAAAPAAPSEPVAADAPPVPSAPLADTASAPADVPPTDYGVDPLAVPQAEPFAPHALFLPALAGPAAGSAQSAAVTAGAVTADSARTTDNFNVPKAAFNVGNPIRYYGVVYNSTGFTRSAFFTWSLSGPCGNSTLWSGWLSAPPGPMQWYLAGVAPSCPGAYTFTLSVNDGGFVTYRSALFTVTGPGSVTVSSVATLDGANTMTNTFATGAPIQYVANLTNTTTTPQTALLTYLLAGPCGAETLWSGNVSTPVGLQAWSLSRTVPSCAGVYTFTAQVNYGATVSQRAITFTVFPAPTVGVTAVRTANLANTTQASFAAGAPIRYLGTISNTTGVAKTVFSVWSIAGPACTGVLWQGNLSVAPGAQEWFLDGVAAPYCSGNNTFTLSVTYNAQTTARNTPYTVTPATLPPAPAP